MVDERRQEVLIKQVKMTAGDGGDDIVANSDCMRPECMQVLITRARVCVVTNWQGAEGFPFQHQQADESLGPNSLEAELALLLSIFYSSPPTLFGRLPLSHT